MATNNGGSRVTTIKRRREDGALITSLACCGALVKIEYPVNIKLPSGGKIHTSSRLTCNEEHRPGCRALLSEYDLGWARGFHSEEPIPCWCYSQYSTEFIRGYLAGKSDIDQSADDAAQAECSYERPL